MKLKLISYAAAIAIVAGIAGLKIYGRPNSELTQMQLENVEALTQSEYPIFIPCVASDQTCTVTIVDASGQKRSLIISKSKKAAPYL